MCRADTNSLRRNQENAVLDAQEAAALTNQLRETRMPGFRAVDLIVYFVNELQFFLDLGRAGLYLMQPGAEQQALADHFYRGLENGPEQAGVLRCRLSGVL